MAIKSGLFAETVTMAFETVRTQKMRSALTVLGVVIGITSIVGMTAIIRGFDESLRESILQLGADTIFVTQFSGVSLAANQDFSELMRRPSLTVDDGAAIGAQSPSIAEVALILGQGGRSTQDRLFFEGSPDEEPEHLRDDRQLYRRHAPRRGNGSLLHGR